MEQSWKHTMRWRVALLMGASIFATGFAGLPALAQDKKPTAREVVAAIQEHVGIPWQKETVDTFKEPAIGYAGDEKKNRDDDGDARRAAASGGKPDKTSSSRTSRRFTTTWMCQMA